MANDRYVSLIDQVGRRYGCRPSAILGIEIPTMALDFDIAVAIRAGRIERGEITDPKLIRQRQKEGFKSVRALQERIRKARQGMKKG